MGGVGSGGPRPGAGRPRKKPETGTGRVLTYPQTATAPVCEPVELDETQAPNDLTPDERLVWMELARIAMSRGKTLAEVQAYPFRLLCKNVALEQRYSRSVNDAGTANHRGMIQAIDRELLRFGLIDVGKAASAKPAPAANPFAAAFGGR